MRLLPICLLGLLWLIPADAQAQYRYRGGVSWNGYSGNTYRYNYGFGNAYRPYYGGYGGYYGYRARPYWGIGISPYVYSYSVPQTYYSYDTSIVTQPRSSLYLDTTINPVSPMPSMTANQARMEVRVPNDNDILLVEGQIIQGSGRVRYFTSPELQPGQNYTYTIALRREARTGGQADEQRSVTVRAGTTVLVDFLQPATTKLPLPTPRNPFAP